MNLSKEELASPNPKIIVEEIGIERYRIFLPATGVTRNSIFHLIFTFVFLFGALRITLYFDFTTDLEVPILAIVPPLFLLLNWVAGVVFLRGFIVRVTRSHEFKIERSKLIISKDDWLSKTELEIPFEGVTGITRKKIDRNPRFTEVWKMLWHGQMGFSLSNQFYISVVRYQSTSESFCEGYSEADQKWLVQLLKKLLSEEIDKNNSYIPTRSKL